MSTLSACEPVHRKCMEGFFSGGYSRGAITCAASSPELSNEYLLTLSRGIWSPSPGVFHARYEFSICKKPPIANALWLTVLKDDPRPTLSRPRDVLPFGCS